MRTYDELCDLLCKLGYDDIIVYENPDYASAALGISEDGCVVYDYDLMIEWLVDNGWCEYDIESADFICFNDSFRQTGQPIIYDRFYDEEMRELIAEEIPGADEYEPIEFITFDKLLNNTD